MEQEVTALIILIGYAVGAVLTYLYIQKSSERIYKENFTILSRDEYFDNGYYGLLIGSTILWPAGVIGFIISHSKYL